MKVPPEILANLRRIHADLGAAIDQLSADDPHLDEMGLTVISRRLAAQEEMIFLEGN